MSSSGAATASSPIRVVTRGVLVHRGHLLACEAAHPLDGGAFYVPIGGGVEFGERAADSVVREFREELGRAVTVECLLDVIENLFEVGGEIGHEVVFEYAVSFARSDAPLDLEPLHGHESDGSDYLARWLPIDEVAAGHVRIYPDGLPARLERWLDAGLLATAGTR